MRQYEGQQPQFIHRWLLRDILSEGVSVQGGKRVVRVNNDGPGGRAELVFEDGSKESADLVVGASSVNPQLPEANKQAQMEWARF